MKELYDLFESYLEKELTEKEIQAFELKLKEDSPFREQFESYQALRRQYQDSWKHEETDHSLKQTLQTLGNEYFASPPKKKIAPLWFIIPTLAAACALLVFLFRPGADLYTRYFQAPPAAFTEKGDGQQWYQQAEQAYNQGDFATASGLMDSILQKNPDAVQIAFYKGISLLELGQLAACRAVLEPLAEGTSSFSEDAQWFVSMAYLKEKNYAASLSELQKIPAGSVWEEKAEILKKELKKKLK
ncbi:MAG: hypothetical protein IPL49_10620 [Saprospirales bacterium]|nr:hypothetical protein [Saprospirales bacterium]